MLNVINDDFIEIDPSTRFFWSTLPTIWKTKSLRNFLVNSYGIDLIPEEYFSKELKQRGYRGFTINFKHREVGRSGCKALPHICTALNGGKWAKDWSSEINKLAKINNINTDIRGWNI